MDNFNVGAIFVSSRIVKPYHNDSRSPQGCITNCYPCRVRDTLHVKWPSTLNQPHRHFLLVLESCERRLKTNYGENKISTNTLKQ